MTVTRPSSLLWIGHVNSVETWRAPALLQFLLLSKCGKLTVSGLGSLCDLYCVLSWVRSSFWTGFPVKQLPALVSAGWEPGAYSSRIWFQLSEGPRSMEENLSPWSHHWSNSLGFSVTAELFFSQTKCPWSLGSQARLRPGGLTKSTATCRKLIQNATCTCSLV